MPSLLARHSMGLAANGDRWLPNRPPNPQARWRRADDVAERVRRRLIELAP